jgi:hypothetical protein
MEYIYTDKDGNQTKFTDDMVKAALDERAQLRIDLEEKDNYFQNQRTKLYQVRAEVYNFFSERYSPGDEEIVCSKDDVNELLESIGADKLKSMWTVSGRIEFTVTDIEAETEDDAREQVENNLTVEFDGNIVDDYSIDVNDVDQQ